MGIGIIQNHSQYKNICGNYTYHMPAPVCQSKMKDLGDEFVLTEKMINPQLPNRILLLLHL